VTAVDATALAAYEWKLLARITSTQRDPWPRRQRDGRAGTLEFCYTGIEWWWPKYIFWELQLDECKQMYFLW
jgi:hypothetical protein